MPSAEDPLYSLLTTGSPNPVADLVGARVYPRILRQNTAYPAIRYQRISTARSQFRVLARSTANKATRQQARFQVDCFATTDAGADALAAAVRSVLDGFSGTAAGLRLDSVWTEDEGAELDPDAGSAQAPIYRTRLDFFVSHQE